jgi:hypothetical protein
MNKLLLLVPLVLLNCNKKEEKMNTIAYKDSLKSVNENPIDSSNKGVVSVHDAENLMASGENTGEFTVSLK